MPEPVDIPFTPDLHLRLLLSLDRGQNVQRAVTEAVRPGMRVLDAGTGSGLLSFIALAAGAATVVGVDRHHVDLARSIAEHNGLGDRLSFIEADLADLELSSFDPPKGFDLLLAFIHTNNPLIDEGRSRLVFELRDRLCADGATVVPGAVRYRATGCDRRDWDLHTELTDLDETTGVLRGAYGLDFQPVTDAVRQGLALRRMRPVDAVAHTWRSPTTMAAIRFPRTDVRLLTGAHDFATFDYGAPAFTGFPPQVRLRATVAGRLTGVIWTQELLHAGVPLWTTESYSPLAAPIAVTAGDELTLATGDEWRATNILRTRPSGEAGEDHSHPM
ncbi:class I SAM-dependent methyltransferase [Micromonospora sp. NBC_01699]|uniref:methyltransferase domain-containing protein n=1 Tax=Micromonospora sp. NBC_01699 TaxID=2975984 RepID=UPI002E32ACA6|nr:methyltransferase domain-containing protein [Micromonospora sp. NBC_01699]